MLPLLLIERSGRLQEQAGGKSVIGLLPIQPCFPDFGDSSSCFRSLGTEDGDESPSGASYQDISFGLPHADFMVAPSAVSHSACRAR